MNRYVIRSRHEAFGTLYLGRHMPVKGKAAALSFGSRESAQERIEFWQRLLADPNENLDPKFFGNLEVTEK
jgi:hypothetical protein